ncbi:hypothetical protein B0H15DRAFT_465537 [Mycena belliarum]|uniref:Uncharacterized protein n=1 Tax=Mycena belliarum TaxID=1033014 RepID=A0AAD6UET7_9AGAR|nr:hypothetical protein B0H15DRAFT_465537 [Mycena belliae]
MKVLPRAVKVVRHPTTELRQLQSLPYLHPTIEHASPRGKERRSSSSDARRDYVDPSYARVGGLPRAIIAHALPPRLLLQSPPTHHTRGPPRPLPPVSLLVLPCGGGDGPLHAPDTKAPLSDVPRPRDSSASSSRHRRHASIAAPFRCPRYNGSLVPRPASLIALIGGRGYGVFGIWARPVLPRLQRSTR